MLESNGHSPVATREEFASNFIAAGEELRADWESEHPRCPVTLSGFVEEMTAHRRVDAGAALWRDGGCQRPGGARLLHRGRGPARAAPARGASRGRRIPLAARRRHRHRRARSRGRDPRARARDRGQPRPGHRHARPARQRLGEDGAQRRRARRLSHQPARGHGRARRRERRAHARDARRREGHGRVREAALHPALGGAEHEERPVRRHHRSTGSRSSMRA